MTTYTFTFIDELTIDGKHNTLTIEKAFRGSNFNAFVQKTVKENLDPLRNFLGHFGRANFYVADKETGKAITKGFFECNLFAGRDNLQFYSK